MPTVMYTHFEVVHRRKGPNANLVQCLFGASIARWGDFG